MNPNSLFLQACLGQKTSRAPVWIMRQAGRYLPEYRAIRSKTTFLGLCKTPELAAEVTLQPVDYLGVDAAIIFSDILIVPEAMGQGLTIEEKMGPRLFPLIQSSTDLKKLSIPKPEKAYDYLGKAIRLVRKQLDERNITRPHTPSPRGRGEYKEEAIPLIGFAGSPFTLMAYMVEGQGTKDFKQVKKLLYENKKLAHQLLQKVTRAVIDLLNYQIESGVQAVQIFDSWGGVLSAPDFLEFSLAYVEEVIAGIKNKRVSSSDMIPIIFFAKGTGQYLEKIKSCGANGISLDWTVDLSWARKILGKKIAIQGNLDPTVLLSPPKVIREEVAQVLSQLNSKQAYIFNLGHGITPDVSPENAKYLVKCVKEISSK
ncbi:MAG: uroporphyrinogen decarboxylase [Deltaproteobacteria bacterium]|nr:uroporphyrinogen decarboxylase [Deltaproteobacteria bacterium]